MTKEFRPKTLEELAIHVQYIKDKIDELSLKMDNHYVSKEEFDHLKKDFVRIEEFTPVKKLSYWIAGVGGTVVAASIIWLITLRI